jgi:hypothetical protein
MAPKQSIVGGPMPPTPRIWLCVYSWRGHDDHREDHRRARRHAGVEPGQYVTVKVDVVMGHDLSTAGATCGACFGGHTGDTTAKSYLANPAVAAASAIKGEIAAPEEVA